MGNLFNHECKRIYLLGGEPLLHPDIIELMKIARENFTDGYIFIITNGILLPQKGDDFWKACKDNNINILITYYPIKIDIEKINAMAEKFGVEIELAWGSAEKNRKEIFNIASINLSGDSNIKKSFEWCGRANSCITLSHGRLYPCTFAPHVHHFNKKFNTNIEITDADSIDIYSENDKDAVLKKLTRPIPACRYCCTVPSYEKKNIKWHVTQNDMSEWGC